MLVSCLFKLSLSASSVSRSLKYFVLLIIELNFFGNNFPIYLLPEMSRNLSYAEKTGRPLLLDPKIMKITHKSLLIGTRKIFSRTESFLLAANES